MATTIAAVISDVLRPLGPYALYVALALSVVFLIALFAAVIPPLSRHAKRVFTSYWSRPIILTLGISTLMMFGSYALSLRSASGNGFLAEHSALFAGMQKDLGVMRESVQAIEQNTGEISRNTREISDKMDTVKQETSVDPRKELANLNVSWTVASFVEAMMEGDLEKTRLFLAGGMQPGTLHKGNSALLYAFQPTLGNDPVALIEVAMDAGFDLNEHLVDRSILRHWGSGIPARFETDLTPKGYTGGYLNGEFVGPALLWVTMLATYRVPSESDIATIKYLVASGAEADITLSYLDFSRDWLGEFPAYQKIYPLVKKGAN